MATQNDHPLGAPCLVDTEQPDPAAAAAFYGPLLGWSFDTEEDSSGYLTARLGGKAVSGIAQAPPGSTALWRNYIHVADLGDAISRAQNLGGTLLGDAVDVGTAGRVATVTDSTGVRFCLWQSRTRSGAEVFGEANAWAMSSLHTTDLHRAHVFYGTLFGWKLDETPGAPFSRWMMGEKVVAMVSETDGVAVPPHWAVNFAVADADAVAAHAVALGGTVVMAPFDTPGFRSTVVADPQGGFVALSATRN